MAQRSSDKAIGIRRLGFGVSGPHASPLVGAKATAHMIEHAFARGVRLFDTAPSYGAGEAERRLGEVLKRLPRYDYIVSTKAGINSGAVGKVRDFSAEGVRRSVEASMKRLGVQRLDWLMLHGPAPHELTDELLKMLVEMKFKGDVVALGVAGRGPELDAALDTNLFTVFMAPVHAMLPQTDLNRLNRIKASGAELIGFETLLPAMRSFRAPLTAGATWRLARSIFNRGGPVAAPATPMSVEECLYWALFEAVAHRILITTTNMGHLEANISAVESLRSGKAIASE